jgi:hypothetical protein
MGRLPVFSLLCLLCFIFGVQAQYERGIFQLDRLPPLNKIEGQSWNFTIIFTETYKVLILFEI